jgi:nucleotide-binding universal stress UspA family protein
MEKLSSILAVIPEGGAQGALTDKVCRLVKQSGARVELFLTAPSDYFSIAARCAGMGCSADVGFTMYDSVTPMAEAILRRAAEVYADLIVAPRAQFHLEHCPTPLLLLGKSPWGPEPRFAAAIDVAERDSEAVARGILHVAGFLAQRLVAHLDILYSERETDDESVKMERAIKLAQLVREYHVGCERLQVFDGRPEETLPPLIAARQYDVLVVGSVARHRTLLTTLHSIAKKLTSSTEGDVLIVNPAPEPQVAAPARSFREQLAHQV